MAPGRNRPHRDFPALVESVSGTIISGLVFCTLAWTIGHQVL